MKIRRSGILLHISSLPSSFGIGDLGPGAYQFVDFLTACGQSIWQVLPLIPTSAILGNSPYCGASAFAGNPVMISVELLLRDGLLLPADMENVPVFQDSKVDYENAAAFKYKLLRLACERYRSRGERNWAFEQFCEEHAFWLEDYALFVVLKQYFGGVVWSDWERNLRDREEGSLREWRDRLQERVFEEKFYQYLFFRQWKALRKYSGEKGVQIVGDMPIYVSYDSADVWAHADLFDLNDDKKPVFVAGVPPDYFSPTGQLWGNPVYRWDRLRETGYAWWIRRLEYALGLFDMIRLDHFRGFVGFWRVPSRETTAINGEWVDVPALDFFQCLFRRFPFLPLIAEDLGVITPDVREVMSLYGFPGMKVLLFAFGGDLPTHPYAPHNHTRNCVVYTGTHDNNTARGWFENEASDMDKDRLSRYLGRDVNEKGVHWEMIRLALMSVSDTAILSMQDVLGLGEEARMNVPATTYGNWAWRVTSEQLSPDLAQRLREHTHLYGRT